MQSPDDHAPRAGCGGRRRARTTNNAVFAIRIFPETNAARRRCVPQTEFLMTVLVIAAVGVTASGAFQGPNSGSVNAASDGTFAIDPPDLAFALGAGYVPVRRQSHSFAPMVSAPAAATAGRIVASVALTNTSLTIANNPDTMRKCQVRVDPGTVAITAGICTVTYAANDGTAAQVDALSLVTAASTLLTLPFTKGVLTVA